MYRMELSDKLKDYLEQVLGYGISFSTTDMGSLPFYVRKEFQLQKGMLFYRDFFFLLAQQTFFDTHSVVDAENAINQVKDKLSCIPVLVIDSLSRQERLQLVKRFISFIVPGTQMYLPELGIDFSEHIKEKRLVKAGKLRPAAQALLIVQLLTSRLQRCTFTEIARVLGYTPMSIMRAANELEKLKLCRLKSIGNKKHVYFDRDNSRLWDVAKPYMKSPVKKHLSLLVDDGLADDLPVAGEYALSKKSNLSVTRKCYAADKVMLKRLEDKKNIIYADILGSGVADLEVWAYNPKIMHGEIVDSISLELSFSDSSDARIKEAILELQRSRIWQKG